MRSNQKDTKNKVQTMESRKLSGLATPGAAPSLQSLADLSPAKTRLSELNSLGNLAIVTQRKPKKNSAAKQKQKRANNPHNPHTGITSHHIIPHELLISVSSNFNNDEREEIGRMFLPDFESLTLANFVAQQAVEVHYGADSPNSIHELPEEIRQKPFGDLSDDNRKMIKFRVEGAGYLDFAGFRNLYQSKKDGTLNESHEGGVSGLRDIGESFFEWQGGNLFYGPERIEPGKSDGFDHDASLIYGESFIEQLRNIYNQLRAAEKLGAEGKPKMKEALQNLSALTKNMNVAKYDPSIWISVDSSLKKKLIGMMLPARKHTSKKGATIHKSILIDAITSYAKQQGDLARDLLSKVELGGGRAGVFSMTEEFLILTEEPSAKANLPKGVDLNVDIILAAINKALFSVFKLS